MIEETAGMGEFYNWKEPPCTMRKKENQWGLYQKKKKKLKK